MEAKYYTPEIEEFHIGFEYEIHTISTGGFSIMSFDKEGNTKVTKLSEPDIKVWEKSKVFNPVHTNKRNIFKNADGTTWDLADDEFFYHRSLKDIAELIKNEQIRVKHLDKEDLELLGLQVQITPCGEDTEDYEDIYQDGAVIGSFFPEDEMNVQLMDTYFKVKNKSEFQRLLKQLDLL